MSLAPIPSFTLNSRLEGDTLPVADLSLSTLRLMKDARYPWLILVPRRPVLVEITDLEPEERVELMGEISLVSDLLARVTSCDKINVGAIGNVVSQLHIHVVARFRTDATWPDPVWGRGHATPYAEGAAERLIDALHAAMPKG